MFSFIKKHWVFYLVGAIVAVALGFALALFVGAKGSTPENLHADDVVQAVPLRERDPGRDVFSARNEFFARMYALYDLFTRLFAAGRLADDEKLLSVL